MLRPLPLVAVRKEHHQPARAQPFGLARGDELVDDHLRAVGEVAELRLPQHQRARIGERKAKFEAEYAKLGKRRVADLEAAAVDVAERNELLAGLLVDPDGVAVAEGAAPAVLAGQADAVAFGSRVPNASASAVTQSKPSPVSNIASWRR